MGVEVVGFSDPEQATIIASLVKFCVEYYFSDTDRDRLSVTVQSDISLFNAGRFADCEVLDKKSKTPIAFNIKLVPSGVSFMDQLRLVCHEMVHVKQFNTGEFDVLDNGRIFLWQGNVVCSADIADWCEPWELDA